MLGTWGVRLLSGEWAAIRVPESYADKPTWKVEHAKER